VNAAPLRPAELSDWLIARGQHFVTNDQIAELVGASPSEVRHSLRRQRDTNSIVPVTKGAWVPVPPQYRSIGAPPITHFIDPLMQFLGHGYYIGFLSAAALHGAAHQSPMVMQVVTDAVLRDRQIGSQPVSFIRRTQLERRAILRQIVPTGRINLSTPEVTILDLCDAPEFGGGLSNVATVIAELLEANTIDARALGEQATHYPVAVSQRAGYLLSEMGTAVGKTIELEPLEDRVHGAPQVLLSPRERRGGDRDPRWKVLINLDIEPDL
jgi:predicted transcriptional regulator of viral defense system